MLWDRPYQSIHNFYRQIFQVLNNHAPIISSLKTGVLQFETKGSVEQLNPNFKVSGSTVSIEIKGGVAELNNNKLIVLAD